MAKPIINKINPLDATKDNVITMSYVGNLPYSNRIVIYDATTLAVLYDNTSTNTNFSIEHTIHANTLTNGKKYAIQGQIFDIDGNASALSDKAYFYCLATPSFYFGNVNDGDIINTASIFATLVYQQSDFEDLNEYRYYLYDSTKNLLVESETFYGADNLNYAYRGLEDDKFYYIRAIGNTVKGIQLDTGYIKIFVNYENPEDYKSIASTRLPPFIALATNSLQIIYLSFWVIFDNTIFIKKIFPFMIIAACSFFLIILCVIFLYLIGKDNNDNEKKK